MALAIFTLMLAAAAQTQSASPLPEKPRLICRQGEQMVGSHIRTPRQCKTEEEWWREEEARARASPSSRVVEGQKDGLAKDPSP